MQIVLAFDANCFSVVCKLVIKTVATLFEYTVVILFSKQEEAFFIENKRNNKNGALFRTISKAW